MAPTLVIFGPPTIRNTPNKAQQYLLWLWKFVPGIVVDASIILPDEAERTKFYNAFVQDCRDKVILAAFEHGLKKYGYPWRFQHDSEEGMYWTITFARAAHAIGFHTAATSDNSSAIWDKVRDTVYAKSLERIPRGKIT
jgi:hypothetical protein